MKKLFTLILMALLPMLASAYDAVIDGICYNFAGSVAEVTYKNKNYNSYSGTVDIPRSVTYSGKTYSVTSIGEFAFYKCGDLDFVSIPESVTLIDNYAFSGCSSLKSIVIPEVVTSIGDRAFKNCSSLTSITIPESVTNIDDAAFMNCTGLTRVIVPNIAAWCSISFHSYDSNPLYYAHHLYINETTEITTLVIPESVTSISSQAFRGCSSLTSVAIPESVTSIRNAAFSGCSGLKSIPIPKSVTSISEFAFSGCSNLTSFIIPEGITKISSGTFLGCNGLTSIIIPNSVTYIALHAFDGCESLKSVIIGSSVTSIGEYTFSRCNGLTDVYCLAKEVPKTQINAFSTYNATLHVPDVSVDLYKTTSPWSGFGSIVGLTQDMIDGIREIKNESLTSALSEGEGDWFSLDGKKLSKPQSGINILRYADGTSEKVLVK